MKNSTPWKPLKPRHFSSSLRNASAYWVSTSLGVGSAPAAPGTLGSLPGLLLAWASIPLAPEARLALLGLLIGIGTWSARVISEASGTPDHRSIVVDEVAGMWITAWTLDFQNWMEIAGAFLLFRLLDIWKPWPIRAIDRWSKEQVKKGKGSAASHGWAGFGVMADDLAAGALALGAVLLYQAVKS